MTAMSTTSDSRPGPTSRRGSYQAEVSTRFPAQRARLRLSDMGLHSLSMQRSAGRRFDPVLVGAAALGVAGVLWLGPLVFDQLVFFGDQDQTVRAQDSRRAMVPAAAMLLVAVAALVVRERPWHALVVALPAIVAVPIALLVPSAGYQLLAYGITAPMSLGALLAAALPLRRGLPLAIQLVGLGLLALMGIVASPVVAIIALVAVLVWWRLPHPNRSAVPDRR